MIRKATSHDFDFIYGLHIHPAVNRFLLYEIMPQDLFKAIFDELVAQEILYVYEQESLLIGMFKFSPRMHRCSHIAYLGGIAVHPSFSGQGHAHRMLHEIILLGKEQGALRLELGVSSINTKAIHIYEKAGFVKEGFLKKVIYLKNEGVFLDDISMAYLYD